MTTLAQSAATMSDDTLWLWIIFVAGYAATWAYSRYMARKRRRLRFDADPLG